MQVHKSATEVEIIFQQVIVQDFWTIHAIMGVYRKSTTLSTTDKGEIY